METTLNFLHLSKKNVVTEYLESVSQQIHQGVMTLAAPTPTAHAIITLI